MPVSTVLTLSSTKNITSNQLRMDVLEQSLSSLDLNFPIPDVKDAEVLANPLDVYRTYLALILADAVGCDIDVAYKSIQWPNNIFNGDLAVILPKLRPGAKADEVAVELIKKVRLSQS
jgi:arginyl-tRNA synthetase